MAPVGSTNGWLRASIVWIDEKPSAVGGPTKEVIYELRDDPDMLRQINLPAQALYASAKRGDKILVEPDRSLIVRDDQQGQ
jgi:hypothetical protein